MTQLDKLVDRVNKLMKENIDHGFVSFYSFINKDKDFESFIRKCIDAELEILPITDKFEIEEELVFKKGHDNIVKYLLSLYMKKSGE